LPFATLCELEKGLTVKTQSAASEDQGTPMMRGKGLHMTNFERPSDQNQLINLFENYSPTFDNVPKQKP
jgi:hypothetical protein